jgi:hypothetical protein
MKILSILQKFFKIIIYGIFTFIGFLFLYFSFYPNEIQKWLDKYNLTSTFEQTSEKLSDIRLYKPSAEELNAINSKGIYVNYPQKSMRFSLTEMGLAFNDKKVLLSDPVKFLAFQEKLIQDLNYLAISPVISLENSEFYQLGEGASLILDTTNFLNQITYAKMLQKEEPRVVPNFQEKFVSENNLKSNQNLLTKLTSKPIQLKAGRTELNLSADTIKSFVKSKLIGGKEVLFFDQEEISKYLKEQNEKLNFASDVDFKMGSVKLSNHLMFRLTEENPSRTFILPITGSFSLSPMTHDKFIEVNKSQQRAYLFENGNLVRTLIISTGVTWETPTGTFKVLNKVPMTISYSGYWYMPWYLPIGTINGPYYFGFHEVPYHMDYKGMIYSRDPETIGSPATGGCIQVLKGQAKELFDWAETGMPVYITE